MSPEITKRIKSACLAICSAKAARVSPSTSSNPGVSINSTWDWPLLGNVAFKVPKASSLILQYTVCASRVTPCKGPVIKTY